MITAVTFDRQRPSGLLARLLPLALLAFFAIALAALPARPAHAIEDYGLVEPGAGATITGPVTFVASVTATALEEVTRVDIAFLRGGAPFGNPGALAHSSGPRTGGTSQWVVSVDPSAAWVNGGGFMPNGAYHVQVRVHSSVQGVSQEPTPWRGIDVVFDVAPPPTSVKAAETDGAQVRVAWRATPVPDFTRYVVERSVNGAPFRTLASVSDKAETSLQDTADAGGRYAYRVTVYRTGGRGDERASAPSAPRTVSVDGPSPSPHASPSPGAQPEPGDEGPAGSPGGSPGGSPDGGDAPSGSPAASPGAPPGGAGSGGGSPRQDYGPQRSGGIGIQSGLPLPLPSDEPVAAPSGANSSFDRILDYGENGETTRRVTAQVTEHEVVRVPRPHSAAAPPPAPVDSGVDDRMLTVFDEELDRRRVLQVVALGLVFVLTGAHLRRFLNS